MGYRTLNDLKTGDDFLVLGRPMMKYIYHYFENPQRIIFVCKDEKGETIKIPRTVVSGAELVKRKTFQENIGLLRLANGGNRMAENILRTRFGMDIPSKKEISLESVKWLFFCLPSALIALGGCICMLLHNLVGVFFSLIIAGGIVGTLLIAFLNYFDKRIV